MSQQKSLHQIKWLSTILVLITMLLTACGSSKSSIIGKWEVVSGDIGAIYEFFEDGTVSVDGFAGKYSWPDKTHIKLEVMIPIVYAFSLSGDELTLTDTTYQSVIVMKRYREFNPSPQVVAGTWTSSSPDSSSCFKALGLSTTPQEIILGTDGSVVINDSLGGIIGSGSIEMEGQYTISGNNLNITASGTETSSGILGLGAGQTQLSGSFSCHVTVSNSRLTFSDGQGQTVFVRKGP